MALVMNIRRRQEQKRPEKSTEEGQAENTIWWPPAYSHVNTGLIQLFSPCLFDTVHCLNKRPLTLFTVRQTIVPIPAVSVYFYLTHCIFLLSIVIVGNTVGTMGRIDLRKGKSNEVVSNSHYYISPLLIGLNLMSTSSWRASVNHIWNDVCPYQQDWRQSSWYRQEKGTQGKVAGLFLAV